MTILQKNWGLIFVLIFSWWAIKPLFHPGFFSMHDDTQVVRVYEMAQALKNGQFPVRWVNDLGYGYGYPLFNFYAPLPYYAGAFFNLLDLNILLATKMMFFLGIILSGVFMYLLAREFFGQMGGSLAGLFYIYAPYHAVDIYVRGAVGEFWAMAFLPLMAWGFYKVFRCSAETNEQQFLSPQRLIQALKIKFKIQKNVWRWILIGSIGYAGVILSHNLIAMMLIFFLLFDFLIYSYLAYRKKKLFTVYYLLVTIVLGLGLSAFYWLPALQEMKFTNVQFQIGGGADFHDHFVCISQLWNSPWGFGGSAPGCISDGMSFQIGKLQLILTFAILILVIFRWRKEKGKRLIVFSSVFYLLFAIFMTSQYSKFVWEFFKPMAYIQYPWRFLVFAIFATSFISGYFLSFFKNRFLSFFIFCLLLGSLIFYRAKYFQPQKYLDLTTSDYTSGENIKWKTSKISDEFLPLGFPKPKSAQETAKEKITALDKSSKISNPTIKSQRYTFEVEGENNQLLSVNLAFFPGWKIYVDGREKLIYLVRNRQVFFAVPPGKHQVEIAFKNTPIRTTANLLSLISLIILVRGILYAQKKVKS